MLNEMIDSSNPDAALLSLGTRFQILCDAAAGGDPVAVEALPGVADKIVKIPARTLPGLIAKAKVAMVLKEEGQDWSLVEAFAMLDHESESVIINQ